MPWTPKQKRYLLSSGSPLKPDQKLKMKQELHDDPMLGHKVKKRKTKVGRARDVESSSYDFRQHLGRPKKDQRLQ